MGKIGKCFLPTFLLLLMTASSGLAQVRTGVSAEGILVGRIAHIEGQLLRYVPEAKDWVATVKDVPFGLNDSLYSEATAKAELIMPNNTWMRIGGSTQIQLITLRMDVTEVDVASGMARLYNRSSSGVIKATSPFGYVVAPAGTIFDLYVGDQSLEVISLKGKVDFILNRDQSRYEVTAGSSSIVSDGQQVTSGQGNVDAEWDDWNAERDRLWMQRTEVKGDSVRYLPSNLRDDSYLLDENGRWERVYYEGGYRYFWRPVNVAVGWAPYTMGRWTVYYGDNCWVPYEPFGYVTHHYGNWVFVGSSNCWYWAPPVVSVGVSVGPFLPIPFGWYPGRVGWIYSGLNVGWVPLAPSEPYYGHRQWGPSTVIVNNININTININRYQYINRAVVVSQNNFYNVNNYQNVRITNINKNIIINNYRAAPVINNTIIRNFNDIHQRYDFTNIKAEHKPHDIVMSRIAQNDKLAQQARGLDAHVIERNAAAIQAAKPVQDIRIEAPKITDKLVRGNEASRPQTDLQLQQRELKARSKPPSEIVTGQGPSLEGRPGLDSPRVQPGEAARNRMPTGQGQRVRPLKPGQEMVTPGPKLLSPSGQDGQTVRPPRPGSEVQPVEPGQVKTVPGDTRRVRPPAPQQAIRPPQGGPVGQPAEQGQGVKRSRPGGDFRPGEAGQAQSPLNDTRRTRPPALQQDLRQPQGGLPRQQGNQDQHVKPQMPPKDVKSGEPGQIRSPNNTQQRLQPPGGGQEPRQQAPRQIKPPAEERKHSVTPQESSRPGGVGEPPGPRQQMNEQRSPVPRQHSAGL